MVEESKQQGNPPVLGVTGASGPLGRRVVELALAAKAGRIVATTRHPDRLRDLESRGVVVRRADFDQPFTLVGALAGVQRLLIISTDAAERPARRVAQHLTAVSAAATAGVEHILYTSLTNPGHDSPVLLAPEHRKTEEAIAATRLDYTILRNNLYLDQLLLSLPAAVASGELLSATADGAAGYVTREDCARTAAAALAAPTGGRQVLDVTGPSLVTHADLARLLGEITGRPIRHIPVAPERRRADLERAGVPTWAANLAVSFEVAIARGVLAVVSPVVAGLTGTPPESAAGFLARHRDALLRAGGSGA